MSAVAGSSVTVADLIDAVRRQGEAGFEDVHEPEPVRRERASETAIVVGAHSGAGASVVSVALVDALAASGTAVELVDAVPRELSGLAGVAEQELGGSAGEWRQGRRGGVRVFRTAPDAGVMGLVPPLPWLGSGSRVIDGGWLWRLVATRPNGLWPPEHARVIVVCRATVPGVRHGELALAKSPDGSLVACVGERRLASAVAASCGPLMHRAADDGRLVLIPSDRRVAVNGIDTDSMPGPIAAAATRLAQLVWPAESGAAVRRTSRPKGLRR